MAEDFTPGRPVALAEGIVRVLAPNPSPMTFHGTNSYLLGWDVLAVIDPGPDNADHLAALIEAIDGRPVSHIVVTHSHLDHSPLAPALSVAVSAPVLAFGDSRAGRRPVMTALAASGLAGGGEGVDPDFAPDLTLADGDSIAGPGWRLTAIHTPGHFGNHLCLATDGGLFTGDHVMDWSTSLVSPPDGDLTAFMASCARLERVGGPGYPGHGGVVADVGARARALVDHRKGREAQIRAALAAGPATARDLARAIYTDIAPALLPAAERNVFAHLIDLHERSVIASDRALGIEARFHLT